MGKYAFRDRPLTDTEMEILRLTLSTFRDGSGQQLIWGSMPNSRDYERALAAVVNGTTPENKGIFDVAVPTDDGAPFGISCKMVKFPPARHLCSFMELSNASAKFRDHLLTSRVTYATEPMLAGPAIIDLVSLWHAAEAVSYDLEGSRYSVLAHDSRWEWFLLPT